jgi:hypothetical protein
VWYDNGGPPTEVLGDELEGLDALGGDADDAGALGVQAEVLVAQVRLGLEHDLARQPLVLRTARLRLPPGPPRRVSTRGTGLLTGRKGCDGKELLQFVTGRGLYYLDVLEREGDVMGLLRILAVHGGQEPLNKHDRQSGTAGSSANPVASVIIATATISISITSS